MRMRIRCAICDKPVDEWTVWEDEADYVRRIVARCHGEEDSMQMPIEWLDGLSRAERTALEQSEGVAFATKRVAAA